MNTKIHQNQKDLWKMNLEMRKEKFLEEENGEN